MSSGPASAGRPAKLRVRLRCDLAEVRPNVEKVRRFLIKAGCAEKDALECELALVEACSNAIQYVDGGSRQEPVIIDTTLQKAGLELRVTDHTPGFDWPERSSLPNTESERGRGIFLIQSLMHSTEYVKQQNGNVLVMRKRVMRG